MDSPRQGGNGYIHHGGEFWSHKIQHMSRFQVHGTSNFNIKHDIYNRHTSLFEGRLFF